MTLALRGNVSIDGAVIDNGPNVTANAAAGVRTTSLARPPRRVVLTLSSVAVSIAAANDYGSVKLCDLATTTNAMVMGCVLSAAVTVAGTTVVQADNLDVAIGTVATTSTTFANAGEKNILAKQDGVGAAATGTVSGLGTATESDLIIAAGTNAIYLNISQPVATGTGTATFTGTVVLTIQDLS